MSNITQVAVRSGCLSAQLWFSCRHKARVRCVFVMVILVAIFRAKRLYEWASSKDLYTERDWNRVVNKEVIFYFHQHLVRWRQPMHWAALLSEITLNKWKDSTTKILLSEVDIQSNDLLWIWDWTEEWILYQMQVIITQCYFNTVM